MSFQYSKLANYINSLGGKAGEKISEPVDKQVPLFVSAPYIAYRAEIFGKERLVLLLKGENLPMPTQIQTQAQILASRYSQPLLFVFPDGSKEFCKTLIAAKVPFIIPGKQIFIPGNVIGIAESKFDKSCHKPLKHFSPWAQVFLIHFLLHKEYGNELSFQVLLSALAMNKVYLSRSARELEEAGVAQIISSGRHKKLIFLHDRRKTWELSLEYLVSPVVRKIRVSSIPERCPKSGISALSEYSNLNDNADLTFAVYSRNFSVNNCEVLEFSGVYLELWKYNPVILAKRPGIVDRLSLYLSLKDDPDPRVSGELNDMMEAFQW